jgi:hypothetical protein
MLGATPLDFNTILSYLWVAVALLLVIALFMISSPRYDYRMIGYSWFFWASIVFLIWCACGYCQYWYLGLIGILYALWGYTRNKPQEPTAQELEEESGVKVPGYE